jgi:hypothetical protein
VLGSATRLLRDTLRFICTLRAQGGVATIRVGAPTLFVVVDPRHGLSTSEGTCHLRQRRLMQPALRLGQQRNEKVAVSGVTAGRLG